MDFWGSLWKNEVGFSPCRPTSSMLQCVLSNPALPTVVGYSSVGCRKCSSNHPPSSSSGELPGALGSQRYSYMEPFVNTSGFMRVLFFFLFIFPISNSGYLPAIYRSMIFLRLASQFNGSPSFPFHPLGSILKAKLANHFFFFCFNT